MLPYGDEGERDLGDEAGYAPFLVGAPEEPSLDNPLQAITEAGQSLSAAAVYVVTVLLGVAVV